MNPLKIQDYPWGVQCGLCDAYQLIHLLVRPQNTKTWFEKAERIDDQTDIRCMGQNLTTD